MTHIATYKTFPLILISGLLISYCAQPLNAPTHSAFDQGASTDTNTAIAVNATKVNINTKAPTPIPFTETPIAPTFTAVEKEQFVRGLLSPPGECLLPCWLAVVPGETPWDQAKVNLEKNGLTFNSFELPPDSRVVYNADVNNALGEDVHFGLNFYVENNRIDAIALGAEGTDVAKLQEVFQAYTPDNVVKVYGKPSKVWINSVYQGTSSVRGYGVWLFYDDLGMLIKYEGTTHFGPVYKICPRFEKNNGFEKISIYARSKDSTISLADYGGYLSDSPEYFLPIQVFGITIDDFYTIVSDDSSKCFEIDGTKFP